MKKDPRIKLSGPLTPAEVKVAVALAGGQTVAEAAEAAGVSRSAIYGWLSNSSEFQEKYDIMRQKFEDELHDRLIELRTLALEKLRAILAGDDIPPSVQLRAALAVLKTTLNPAPQQLAAAVSPAKSPALNKTGQNSTLPAPTLPCSGPSDRVPLNKTEQNPTPSTTAVPLTEPSAGPAVLPPLNKTEHNSPSTATAPPRNAPCPCGSGIKYKRCCARNAPPLRKAA